MAPGLADSFFFSFILMDLAPTPGAATSIAKAVEARIWSFMMMMMMMMMMIECF